MAVVTYAHTHPSGSRSISNLKVERLHELMAMVSVMLIVLAVINTTFIAWATAADSRFSSALERALGATARQVVTGLSVAAVLPAMPAALVGIPLGLETYHLLDPGQTLTAPPVWQLVGIVLGSVLAVAAFATVASRYTARRPPAQTLQVE